MDRFACGSTIIAIFNLVQDLMVLLRVLLQQKKDSHCLETYFHDTILLHHHRWEVYIKKYWNVAIFKLRLLNDQHADCEYTWFRGKMTQTPVVVRHKARFIANLSYVTYFFKLDLMYIWKNGIQHVVWTFELFKLWILLF